LLSDDEKVARVNSAKWLQQEFLDAMRRNWDLFWTGEDDEFFGTMSDSDPGVTSIRNCLLT
jgi:hypothetical protein